MKPVFCIMAMLIPVLLKAQPEPISRELASLINIPALIREGSPAVGEHTSSTTLRFDKFVVIASISSKVKKVETFLYINSRTGDIATRTGELGTLGDGALNNTDEKFNLTYYAPTGLLYHYYNLKKGDVLEHCVSSLNTDVAAFSPDLRFENTWVFRAGASKTVLPENFKAAPYKANGETAPKIHLVGGPKIEKLLLKRMIGFNGIGYVKTDKGIFMVVEIKSGEGAFTSTKWKQVEYSLDKTQFNSVEAKLYDEWLSKNEAYQNKLENAEFSGACAGLASRLNQLKIEHNKEQKRLIEESAKGNMINDASTRNAMLAMIDPLHTMREAALGADLSLCNLESRGIRNERDQRKLGCLTEYKQTVLIAIQEMEAINRRYPNNKFKAHSEKLKVLKRVQASRPPECAGS